MVEVLINHAVTSMSIITKTRGYNQMGFWVSVPATPGQFNPAVIRPVKIVVSHL